MSDKQRQDGWYWVKRGDAFGQIRYKPAYLDSQRDVRFTRGEVWTVAGEAGVWAILNENEIGPRIPMPDERAAGSAPEQTTRCYTIRICRVCGNPKESPWVIQSVPTCECGSGAAPAPAPECPVTPEELREHATRLRTIPGAADQYLRRVARILDNVANYLEVRYG